MGLVYGNLVWEQLVNFINGWGCQFVWPKNLRSMRDLPQRSKYYAKASHFAWHKNLLKSPLRHLRLNGNRSTIIPAEYHDVFCGNFSEIVLACAAFGTKMMTPTDPLTRMRGHVGKCANGMTSGGKHLAGAAGEFLTEKVLDTLALS